MHFLPSLREGNRGSHQCLHWWQELSTGQFLCYGFESCSLRKEKRKKAIPIGMTFSFLASCTDLDVDTKQFDKL